MEKWVKKSNKRVSVNYSDPIGVFVRNSRIFRTVSQTEISLSWPQESVSNALCPSKKALKIRNLKTTILIINTTVQLFFLFWNLPKDPAFSTGGRPIFKFKNLCIGSLYNRNQNRFRIYNLSSIKFNLTLGYQKSE